MCERRNFIGIQLIDRNDELCICYEKRNIQDNVIRKGMTEIKQMDDDCQTIKIELSHVSRKLQVALKQVPEIPKRAEHVVQLKGELGLCQATRVRLTTELEDPENEARFRELQGEDPDEESLEAKIQVLEQRLNNKKEGLLEKDLILDEVTTLAEKLREQALSGRQSTLELTEKVSLDAHF
jgi:hypothetical protein